MFIGSLHTRLWGSVILYTITQCNSFLLSCPTPAPHRSERLIAPLAKTVTDIAHTLGDYARRTHASLLDFYTGLSATLREKLVPAGQEALHRLAAAFAKLADETYGLVVSVAERLVATVRQFEPEFAQFGQRVTALAKRLGGYAERYVQWARKEAADLWKLILDSVHELPGWEYARDKYTEVSAGWVVVVSGADHM